MGGTAPWAHLGGVLATDLQQSVDLREQPHALQRGGWWAVAATFEGALIAHRFGTARRSPLPEPSGHWVGPPAASWVSSLDRAQYISRVGRIQRHIEAGDVYQVNLCRMLTADRPRHDDPAALAALLAAGNPAPYQGVIHDGNEWIVTASPELFLSREKNMVSSSPIKGTAPQVGCFAHKDTAENIMITDLVRNDLNRICTPDSVRVQSLLAVEEHPGLAHLVSTVTGRLRPNVEWAEIFAATFPPGSVSGAPKLSALKVIAELEAVARGPYCGAVGYVDADRGRAELAVGIRSFFTRTDPDGRRSVNFGTGAGITYPSDAAQEWQETELKAARLMSLAAGRSDVRAQRSREELDHLMPG